MILDLVFLAVLLGLVLFSRLLPQEPRHDFLSTIGFVGLYLYAPLPAWFLTGAVILATHLWLRRRQRFFLAYYLIWFLWAIGLAILPPEPILIGRFDPLYLLPYNLQRILHFIFEDGRGKMRTSTLRSLWHYCFLFPLLLGTVEWFHDYYSVYKKKHFLIFWKDGLKGLGKAFLKCYIAAFLLAYLIEPFMYTKDWDWIDPTNLLFGLCAVVAIGVSFTLNVMGTFEMVRALMAFLGYKLERRIFGPFWKAKSVVEFWSNWNIPMVVFVREYIYIPFMGLFSVHWRTGLVFAIMLFWAVFASVHGALWTFFNGLAIYIQIRWTEYKAFRPDIKSQYNKFVPVLVRQMFTLTFIALISIIWPGGSTEIFFSILYAAFVLIFAFAESVFLFFVNLVLSSLPIV